MSRRRRTEKTADPNCTAQRANYQLSFVAPDRYHWFVKHLRLLAWFLTRKLARLMVVMAAVILTFAPSMDSAAFAAKQNEVLGTGSRLQQILSACDVVEDSLDHLPDRNRLPADHQVSLVAVHCGELMPLAHVVNARARWDVPFDDCRARGLASGTFRPPQA